MESIQINACLVITRTSKGTSKETNEQGTSKEKNLPRLKPTIPLTPLLVQTALPLSNVSKTKHPKYLFNLIPVRSTPYAIRTVGNILLIKTKHKFYKIYIFFQSVIIEWNNLDPSLRYC